MLPEILGGILKNGATGPQQIKVEDNGNENIVLYCFAAIVLIIVAVIFVKVFQK